MKKSIAVNCTD